MMSDEEKVQAITAPLAEHEDMGRWKRLPVWAQQELEQWRRDEAHQRGRAEALDTELAETKRQFEVHRLSVTASCNSEIEEMREELSAARAATLTAGELEVLLQLLGDMQAPWAPCRIRELARGLAPAVRAAAKNRRGTR